MGAEVSPPVRGWVWAPRPLTGADRPGPLAGCMVGCVGIDASLVVDILEMGK